MTLIDSNNLPTHIGIIMDGNGRWAESQKMERIAGHIQGVETVKEIVESCAKLGIPYLTLYTCLLYTSDAADEG